MKLRHNDNDQPRWLTGILGENRIMNQYIKNLEKIEFVVTMACTGNCKHCSEGDHDGCTEHINAEIASEAVRKICSFYDISTVMTFGGEPLLYPETVCVIHKTAASLGVAKRQVITNGFFSKNKDILKTVALSLADSGVNDLLLSVDAFHQETIPLDTVMFFAENAVNSGIPVKLQPAWLVSSGDQNSYNVKTKEIIRAFEPLHIPLNPGNVVFPSGNALKYLREYFDDNAVPFSPYEEDPEDIKTISFGANGDVLNGNVYETDILEIIRTYRP